MSKAVEKSILVLHQANEMGEGYGEGDRWRLKMSGEEG